MNCEIGGCKETRQTPRQPFANPSPTLRQHYANPLPTFSANPSPLFPWTPGISLEARVSSFLVFVLFGMFPILSGISRLVLFLFLGQKSTYQEHSRKAGPKRGSLNVGARNPQESATFLQHSFFNVAVQSFVRCSAAFGKSDFRIAGKRMLQCNFCRATFRK